MAGETQVLHLPFAGGLDELVAKEYLDASSRQAAILNGDFVKTGSISKRNGLEYLSTALLPGGELTEPAAGVRAVGWSRSSLSLLGSSKFYQHTKAPVGGEDNGGLVGVGTLPNVGVVRRPLIKVDKNNSFDLPTLCDLTYSGHLLRVSLFRDSVFDTYASVYDVESGNTILGPTLVAERGGQFTYIVSAFALPDAEDGPVAVIVFHDTFTGSVKYSTYAPSTNSFSALATLVAADVNTVDAAPYEDDPASGWLVLYDVNGSVGVPGDTLELAYWTLEGQQAVVDQTVEATHALGYGAYVCGRYGQSVWLVWKTTLVSDFYWAQRRIANTSFVTATTAAVFQEIALTSSALVPTGIAHLGTDKIFVSFRFEEAGDGSNWGTFLSAWRVLSHTAGTVSSLAFGQIPMGLIATTRPFVVEGEVYQSFVYNLNHAFVSTDDLAYKCKQTTLYLCKFGGVSDSMSSLGTIKPNRCLPVATAAPRQASVTYQVFDSARRRHVGFPSSVDRETIRLAVGINTISPDNDLITAGAAWAVDFFWGESEERGLYQTSEIGSELSISGGVPFVADGQSTFEDGFFNYPEFTSQETDTGGALPEGVYSFAVVYTATDAAGLVHRSAPFILDPLTVAPGYLPTLHITPPLGSYRDVFATEDSVGKISAEVYITAANGSTLFYHGSVVVSNVFTVSATAPWPLYVDYEILSAAEDGAPLLYTTGGVLDHVNPPASSSQIVHQKRKALVDETRRGVWMTKQFSPGQAPGFNEALYQDFPEGGDIEALGSLDSRLLALKKNSIWFIEGQGPSPNGQGASWGNPELIPSDVGAKSWQSVVSMPNGIMFQGSDNGIHLLGRDLTVSFIGKNVVDSTNAYPNVVSATLVPSSNHVRFLCLDSARENHLVLVYDYLLGAWTTHRYDHLSDVPVAVCVSSDSTPRYTVLTADGGMWQERLPTDAARCLDDDNGSGDLGPYFVPTVITTPFVKLQVQGYHRARRVQFFGEREDSCGLQIQMAFNYDATIRQTCTWSAAQLNSLHVKGQVEAYVAAAYNKGMALQVTFSDTDGGEVMTTGAGMRFASTAIELQNLGSRYRLLSAGARR